MSAEPVDRVTWLKWIDRFSGLLAILAGVATVGLMINVVLDVAMRATVNRSLPGTLDLSQYVWMPSIVSLALGYALLRGEHIRVNLLTAPTGRTTQRVIEIVSMAFTLLTAALFLWFSVEKAIDAMDFGETAVGARWVSIWIFRWVVAVGIVGLIVQSFAQIVRAVSVRDFISPDADELDVLLEAEDDVFDELGDETEKTAATAKRELVR